MLLNPINDWHNALPGGPVPCVVRVSGQVEAVSPRFFEVLWLKVAVPGRERTAKKIIP